MNYRIKIETEESGKKWYYVQYRFFFFFWLYHREVRDITYHRYKVAFNSLEDAKSLIQNDINEKYSESQKKIVKKEILTN